MHIKQLVPWWAKIAAKVALSRARLDYGRWQRWGLFVHGAMDRPEYAVRVLKLHLARIGWSDCVGKIVLELGPGDSLATAIVARTLGAAKVYLVDAGAFATTDMSAYRALQSYLELQGMRPPDLSRCETVDQMLAACGAEYLTDGLNGLRSIAPASVDFVFSQAVLEHVRAAEFDDTQCALRRILKADGIASHDVDLKDHLGGALNSLRFSDATWEADWMVRSGFYTNRLRYREILASMERAGFVPEVTSERRWPFLPTPRARLAARFQAMSDADLGVKEFDCLARVAPRDRPRVGAR